MSRTKRSRATVGLGQALRGRSASSIDWISIARNTRASARAVEPDVQRARVVAQRERAGAAEDHDVAPGGGVAQRRLERLAVV